MAVAIGAIVAALVATVVTDAVTSQRAIINRDEMSEFANFFKTQLNSDATCEKMLFDLPFEPGGGPKDIGIKLPPGMTYEGTESTTIDDKFKFANGQILVTALTIEDKGMGGVPVIINPAVTTKRFVARITLSMKNVNGQGYRSRFYEIPLIIDTTKKTVFACNGEINLADSCKTLGFDYDPVTRTCKNSSSSCLTGGSYQVNGGGPGGKNVPNPVTGALSCPAGFIPTLSGSVNINDGGKKGSTTYDRVYQCLKC